MDERQALLAREVGEALAEECGLPLQVVGRMQSDEEITLLMLQALRERSFVVASFGKLLHTTGWKIGYCVAPAMLTREFRKIHQFNVFSVNTPMQIAIAEYLKDIAYIDNLAGFFEKKRDLLKNGLKESRFKC